MKERRAAVVMVVVAVVVAGIVIEWHREVSGDSSYIQGSGH